LEDQQQSVGILGVEPFLQPGEPFDIERKLFDRSRLVLVAPGEIGIVILLERDLPAGRHHELLELELDLASVADLELHFFFGIQLQPYHTVLAGTRFCLFAFQPARPKDSKARLGNGVTAQR